MVRGLIKGIVSALICIVIIVMVVHGAKKQDTVAPGSETKADSITQENKENDTSPEAQKPNYKIVKAEDVGGLAFWNGDS